MDAKDSTGDSLHPDPAQSASSVADSDRHLETPDWDATDPAHPMLKLNRAYQQDDIIARTKFTLPPLPSSTPLYQPPSSPVKPPSPTGPLPQASPVQPAPSPPSGPRNNMQNTSGEPGSTVIVPPSPTSPTPSMKFMFPPAPGTPIVSGPLPLNDQPFPYASASLPRRSQKSNTHKPLVLIPFMLLATFVLALIGSVVGITIASQENTPSPPSIDHRAMPVQGGHIDLTSQPAIPGQRSFQVGVHSLVTITGHKGDINISSGNNGTIVVNARKHGSSSASSSVDAMIKYIQSKDEHGQDRVDINTLSGYANVDFDVTMPASAQVQIQIDGGSIAVNGLSGVSIDTFSGSLDLQNIQGPVDVQTENGDIIARTLKGQAKMQTQNGSIRINSINGQLQALTHNGDVIVRKATLKGQSILETNSGSVRVDGSLDPDGNYTLRTNRGDIDLSLPANAAFQLAAHTASGSISNAFGSYSVGMASRPPLNINIAGGGSITINQSLLS